MKRYRWQTVRRVAFVLGVVALLPFVVGSIQATLEPDPRAPVTEASIDGLDENMTVVASQGSNLQQAGLYVFDETGELVFFRSQADQYFDVDPLGDDRILYLRANHVECGAETCAVTELVEFDVASNTTEVRWSDIGRGQQGWQHHDVDPVGPDALAVADIESDRVYEVNLTTGVERWGWSMAREYSFDQGGPANVDWTHMNDVEKLPNGWLMASPRNFDQVIFVDPESGLREDWTLGSDDDYDVLNEQHNPDYIPEENGGPAVLVADSQNNRVVEYQRRDGTWEQTWEWRDDEMAWPRDADRLPNGNTLITDSNANRVFEVDRDGEIRWSVAVPDAYDAERIGTGDESRGGESAQRLDLTSRSVRSESGTGSPSVKGRILSLFPNKLVNGLRFITPSYMGIGMFVSTVLSIILLLGVVVGELYYTVSVDVSLRR